MHNKHSKVLVKHKDTPQISNETPDPSVSLQNFSKREREAYRKYRASTAAGKESDLACVRISKETNNLTRL